MKDERFYHGDTAICPFGNGFILAYLSVLSKEGTASLQETFKDRLIALNEEDGQVYAANSFYVKIESHRILVMPSGVSDRLKAQVRERGVEAIEADVSEFFLKGGGSVKCMILDLGPVVE